MEELARITTDTVSVVKIARCLDKIYKKIVESYHKKLPERNIKEIEFLKTQSKSENIHLSLMSCQTLVKLAKDAILDPNNVVTTFIFMLPKSTPCQCTAITENILSLLLINLRRTVDKMKENELFNFQHDLRIQHPIVTLMYNENVNLHDLINKINGICNHHDKQIRDYSLEYLRPVYLYVLCNPQTLPNSKDLWNGLLALSRTNADAKQFALEIISWSKLSNIQNSIFTNIMVMEVVDHLLLEKNYKECLDLCLYQILIVKYLVKYGVDPRPNLQSLLNVLHTAREEARNYYNVMLILFAELLPKVSPIYLPELLRIIVFIVIQENCGNQYILNMCLDGIIQWMSQTAFIPSEALGMAHRIVRHILDITKNKNIDKTIIDDYDDNHIVKTNKVHTRSLLPIAARNFHPDIALAFDMAILMENFDETEFKDVFYFVDTLNMKANSKFYQRLHLLIRCLFLSHEPSMDCWFKIYQVILEIIKVNPDIAYDFLMTYIFKLANEYNPEIQMELLRGLPQFATSKDNIPMILSTINNLTADNATFCMDLYIRLWHVDSRTYPFLLKHLSRKCKNANNTWEHEVAKAYTIRIICEEKPEQHGPDLVKLLSDTLNICTDESGSLATSLAFDAIIALCDSRTVNIISTWQILRKNILEEKRPIVLKAIYKFFAHVPNLNISTVEYTKLVDDALDYLWQTIIRPDNDPELVCEALNALKAYEIGVFHILKHIPPIYRHDFRGTRQFKDSYGRDVIDLPKELIPGECWLQLLKKINPKCSEAVADLISQYIYNEIKDYHSGVYRLPDKRSEPRKLQGLAVQSPLRAMVNYIVEQSALANNVIDSDIVTNALRSISNKFPRPIPPLDWSCLHSFFHISFKTRKYCIMIAKNQLLYSGTAKRLLENFLVEFEPNCFEEDLLLLFSMLPEISNGINVTVLKNFAEKVASYCFKESQLNGFIEGCLFEKFLDSVKYVLIGECSTEVADVFTLIVERHMDSMDIDSRLFERYTEVIAGLNTRAIDGLTSPTNWWDAPIQKLQKATIIRCYLVLYNTKLKNSLNWLNPIIDAFAKRPEEVYFLYRHLAITLAAFQSDEQSCNWVMDMILQIQTLLIESSDKDKYNKALYLLDIFILTIDVLSGYAVLLGNLDIVVTQRQNRLEIFPESLQYLCDYPYWLDHEPKFYEFLLSIYRSNIVPEMYRNTFKDAIICSHNRPFFEAKYIWTKYVGLRK